MPGGTEPVSLGQWCWPRETASSARATGKAPLGPWGGGRRPEPGTLSPTDTAESPGNEGEEGSRFQSVLFLYFIKKSCDLQE